MESKDGEIRKDIEKNKDDTIISTKDTGAAAAIPILVSETEKESEVLTKDIPVDPINSKHTQALMHM